MSWHLKHSRFSNGAWTDPIGPPGFLGPVPSFSSPSFSSSRSHAGKGTPSKKSDNTWYRAPSLQPGYVTAMPTTRRKPPNSANCAPVDWASSRRPRGARRVFTSSAAAFMLSRSGDPGQLPLSIPGRDFHAPRVSWGRLHFSTRKRVDTVPARIACRRGSLLHVRPILLTRLTLSTHLLYTIIICSAYPDIGRMQILCPARENAPTRPARLPVWPGGATTPSPAGPDNTGLPPEASAPWTLAPP